MSLSDAASPSTARTALLVIDVQTSFTARPYWTDADVPAFLAAVNTLVQGFAQAGLPIVRVLHHDGAEQADNPFALASGLVAPLAGLQPFEPALEVLKHRHSALVGTGLGHWLHQRGISRLVVCGIRTEQCCETTTRHASDEGWTVDYVPSATLTFDMLTPEGRRLSTAEIIERTCTVLAGRFATLCTPQEALVRAGAERPATTGAGA
ncbi:cysteine hydrolase family protein [Ideonella livida]|uniref:Isochorismatase family protein n=1 Tax=Ideonella livida TaxID=2707176 RepID=A0A7C9PHY4_9BURK|nr:isochorismatase family protein [Ideonella livida]NDY92376.1 isochorismatase family protein [Ideonella livida]